MQFAAAMEKASAFEENVIELERNVTLGENVTSDLSDLLEQLRENSTRALELVTSSGEKLRVEIWRLIETAMRLNGQLEKSVRSLSTLSQ